MTTEATDPAKHESPLEKTLGLRSVVLFGLAYTAPIIILGIFGVIAEASIGDSAGSHLLAIVAMLFTTLMPHAPTSGANKSAISRW